MCGNTKDPAQVAKAILRKKTGPGGINLPDFRFTTTTKLQPSDGMVLAQKPKYRPMEQDRKLINEPTHLWVP